MLKKIKFNILLGDKYCKNIDDVKNNFNIHDILSYYEQGILEKWLNSQNLIDIKNKVLEINKSSDTFNKINSLMNIFYEDEDKQNIEKMSKEAAHIIEFENKRKSDLKKLYNNNLKEKEVIDNYFKNYENIINSIFKNKYDYEFIKKSVANISNNFIDAFEYDYYRFFNKLEISGCIFGILSIFANENTRYCFLYDEIIMEEISEIITYTITEKEDNYINYIWKKLKKYSNDTKQHFSTVIENKKCLIIHLSNNSSITSFADKTKEYSSEDINNKFLILDGINYMGQSLEDELVYMEI